MWENDYFKQYQSPNIIIVPTVNFCHSPPPPTGSEQIADPITSSPTLNYEQISPVKDNYGEPSTSVSHCTQKNLQFVNTKVFESTSTPQFSENFQNSVHIFENTIPTGDSSCNMNQSIKELSTSKYRSRNNLVDLTGFSLLKKDSAGSLTKHKDLRSIDDTKIEPDKISTNAKDLRNKIIEENRSKKYRDLERRFLAEYPKTSKSERDSRHLPDSKVSLRDRGIKPPDYIQRSKDYQRFMRRYDDHETKYKSKNQLKTKSLSHQKIRIKSCDTRKTKPDVKKQEDERKQSIKSEKRSEVNTIQTNLEKAKNQSNTDKVLIKSSVVRVDRNLTKNPPQRYFDEVQDLRSRLSRKRTRSECIVHYHKPMENRLDRESSVTTVKQDVEASKNSPILAPTEYEPKPKTYKPNELINNMNCPNSNSGDSDEDMLLNYFITHKAEMDELIEEIIENENCEEANPKMGLMKSIQINKGHLHKEMEINSINKRNENYSKTNEETNSKEDLNNHVSMKAVELIQEEENSLHKSQKNNNNVKSKPNLTIELYIKFIEKDSDSEDKNNEIESIANTNKHKDLKKKDQSSKIYRNSQQEANKTTEKVFEEIAPNEARGLCKHKLKFKTNSQIEDTEQQANTTTDVNGKAYVEIAPKETISLCRDEQKIITNLNNQKHTEQDAKNIIDVSGKAHVEIKPKETMSLCKDEQKKITNINNEKLSTHKANNIIDLTGTAYVEITPTETMSLCNDEQKIISNSKYEKLTYQEENNTTDLTGEAYGDNTPQETIELSDDSNDSVVEVIDITDTTSKQPNVNRQYDIRKHIELNQAHGCAKQSKQNSIQKSIDVVEVSRETIFNDTKQQDINLNIEKPSLSSQLINKEKDVVKTDQETIEASSETMINMLDQKKKNIIELSDVTDEHIKIALESQDSVNLILPVTENSIKMDAEIETDPLNVRNVPDIQENYSQKSGLEIVPLCRSDKTFKEHIQIFEDTVNKPANKPLNNIEKKTQNDLKPSALCENELLLGSENSIKETLETAKSSSVQNNEAEGEILQKSKIIQTSSMTNVISEQKTRTILIESNMSNKNILPNPDKNIEDTSEKTSTVKAETAITAKYKELITTITKTDVKNQVKSLETVKNNPQKLETIEDTVSKTSELEISEIVTNTKKGQEQRGANNSLVPNGRKNNIQEQQCSPTMSQLETRMSQFLKKEYTLSSLVHHGRFSTIYKCFDTKGETYSLKVVEERKKGKLIEGIFYLLQRQLPREASHIVYLISAFECKHRWCLLTEYFPKNLAEVLRENKRGFHIDEVQILSRQLVDAVNVLTNANIIHSDIKPAHILINSDQFRLKLCGFDRSNFSNYINIRPNTGTLKYRAPEIILGFQEDHRIDVWSTALVIFEMATNKSLFNAFMNNEVLYQHLSTFRIFDWSMVAQSRYRALHFSGTSFIRQLERNGREKIILNSLQRREFFRKTLFESYYQHWTWGKSKWQIVRETDKLETLHTLLEQMLALDPRNRIPIQFVNACEFMNYKFTIT